MQKPETALTTKEHAVERPCRRDDPGLHYKIARGVCVCVDATTSNSLFNLHQ